MVSKWESRIDYPGLYCSKAGQDGAAIKQTHAHCNQAVARRVRAAMEQRLGEEVGPQKLDPEREEVGRLRVREGEERI